RVVPPAAASGKTWTRSLPAPVATDVGPPAAVPKTATWSSAAPVCRKTPAAKVPPVAAYDTTNGVVVPWITLPVSSREAGAGPPTSVTLSRLLPGPASTNSVPCRAAPSGPLAATVTTSLPPPVFTDVGAPAVVPSTTTLSAAGPVVRNTPLLKLPV